MESESTHVIQCHIRYCSYRLGFVPNVLFEFERETWIFFELVEREHVFKHDDTCISGVSWRRSIGTGSEGIFLVC